MKKSGRLVFFGTEEFSRISFEALLEAGWGFEAVVTKPDAKSGRGRQITEPPLKPAADKYNIPVLQPQKVSEIGHELARLAPTHGVLVSYGAIIPQAIIDLFPGGIINLHPSLLPFYRGPSPIEAAILNGDQQTGLTLMQLTAKMDAGPIYAQKVVPMSSQETQDSLSGKLAALGAHFLIEKLPYIVSGFLHPEEQDESQATYTKLLTKADGRVDWSLPAEIIERQIRAYLNYPKSRTRIEGREIIIVKARVAASLEDGALVKACKPGYLEIEQLIVPSRGAMSGADFLRGYSKKTRKK